MPARSPEEIHALIAAAFNAGDIDAFIELHEEDAVALVPPDGRRVSGRDELRAAVEPIFALRPNARIEVSGRGTIVSRRHPDGTWRIVLDNPMSPD
jgi:uncharacterized protein (TIGR02246 family)